MHILRIDLTNKKTSVLDIGVETESQYLGGRGIGAKILYQELAPKIDPLSPGNKIMFLTSSLMGTSIPSCVKYSVVTKSPLTGTILMSLAGGFFGPKLRTTAYDGIILEGRLEKPGYIFINDDVAEFKDAQHLWGLTTDIAQSTIKRELGNRSVNIACIGPAAERGVLFGTIMNELHAAGRGGAGTVLASKNIKALAVLGSRKPIPRWEREFNIAVSEFHKSIKEAPKVKLFGKYGTPGVLDMVNARGLLPTRNFQKPGVFEYADQINGEANQKFVTKRKSCYRCPIGCLRISKVNEGPFVGAITEGPEYETLCTFGSLCCNSSFEAIIAADEICDKYGMDSISAGNTIAFAMELFERGIINKKETDGLELHFGNAVAMVEMLKKIATREGFGDILAQGVRRAALIIGRGAEKYAMHLKGMEWPGYDPRGAKGMALSFATSPRGACHERGMVRRETFGASPPINNLTVEGKGLVVKEGQDKTTIEDSLGFCCLAMGNGQVGMESIALAFSATIGTKISVQDLKRAAERIWNIERLFNVREGFTRCDDILPKRFLNEPHEYGPAAGSVVEIDQLLDQYYELRGWDINGVPTRETLIDYGLGDLGSLT